MNTSNEIKVSIPKPCHEDWNKMTPNEKGAFCSKCAKTVVDFTKKTTNEIKDFMIAQTGKKICGRFMTDQLDEPKIIDLAIPLHLLPRKLSFNKAFAVAIFIAFGTTLFSCSTQQGEVVGKIAPAIDSPGTSQNTLPPDNKITGDTVYNIISTPTTVEGGVKVKTQCQSLKGDVAVEMPMLGEIAFNPGDTLKVKKDTVVKEEILKGKVKIETK